MHQKTLVSWKHKNKAGDGPRIQDVPIAFCISFSIFGILHNAWILSSNERRSFSDRPPPPSFQLLPSPCWGGSRNSILSIFMKLVILPTASVMKAGYIINDLSVNSANWLKKLVISLFLYKQWPIRCFHNSMYYV